MNYPEKYVKRGYIDFFVDEIEEYGCLQRPLIIDRKMNLIAGHTRLLAAMIAELKDVHVLVVDDLTSEQMKEYRSEENKYCNQHIKTLKEFYGII